MSAQRYERISHHDHDEPTMTPSPSHDRQQSPPSPPPSFRSRTSSPSSRRLLASEDPIATDAEQTLHDTFDDGSDSDGEGRAEDDRQRLMRGTTTSSTTGSRIALDRDRHVLQPIPTSLPGPDAPRSLNVSARPHATSHPFSSFSHSNDGVFANLNAKPERGEKTEEQPPSYEAAAADATPPYWETTILAPGHLNSSDEVYVDGLPVGSLFSFMWNGMISISFGFVGFLLTYLLHTTHAAKNGSRGGLGVTLIKYGFSMRAGAHKSGAEAPSADNPAFAPPSDPNSHDFDPNAQSDNMAAAMAQSAQTASTSNGGGVDWIAYALMIVGWFILIRAVSDFIKARKHEQIVLASPDRGLNVPVVADNERPETAV